MGDVKTKIELSHFSSCSNPILTIFFKVCKEINRAKKVGVGGVV